MDPASEGLAWGVGGSWAKGRRQEITGGAGGRLERRVPGEQGWGVGLGWGRSPGSCAPETRPGYGAHWQVTGRLLAGVPVAGSWGGQGASWRILGSWAAFCLSIMTGIQNGTATLENSLVIY